MKPSFIENQYMREKRQSPRIPFASAIMFENYQARTCHDGRMVDYSRMGMRFETGVAPQLGAEIFIGMEKSPYSSAHDVFRGTVVWLLEHPLNVSYYPYIVGVRYC